mgnify:FL=1
MSKKTIERANFLWKECVFKTGYNLARCYKNLIDGGFDLPSEDRCIAALAGCLNSRSKSFAWRKTAPKDDDSWLLWKLIEFHRDGSSLLGYYNLSYVDEFDEWDSISQMMMLVTTGRSPASEKWSGVLR